MTTLTDSITQELLDSIVVDGGPDSVLKKYRGSKGPLYKGLGKATTILEERFDGRQSRLRKVQAHVEKLEGKKETLESEVQNLQQRQREVNKSLGPLQANVDHHRELLSKAEVLKALGFGEEELARLSELLGQIAASKGAPPEEGVAQFFETTSRYERIISMDLEVRRAESRVATAKANAERFEAEARHGETLSKARIATIATTERLMTKGVKEADLLTWDKVLKKSGTKAEHLVKELERYVTWEGHRKEQERTVSSLRKEAASLNEEVVILRTERDSIQRAIVTVRDRALRDIADVGREARESVGTLARVAESYGEIKERAGILEEYVNMASGIRTADPKYWESVPRPVIQRFLVGFLEWMKIHKYDPVLTPPYIVQRRCFGLSTFTKVSLSDLVLWTLRGLFTESELKAIEAKA